MQAPAGKVLVLRDIDVYVGLTGLDTVGELHVRDFLTEGSFAFFSLDITDSDKRAFSWRGRQVFEGDLEQGFFFDADPASWDVLASGYILGALV